MKSIVVKEQLDRLGKVLDIYEMRILLVVLGLLEFNFLVCFFSLNN